ncbi:MAG: hypothetical protein L0H96_07615 [Humibacillus sp.]|nr:hypothetical protein [Humibacillus sp.]MDN5776760.1 hypothetical protein [Humibacillus sp.]
MGPSVGERRPNADGIPFVSNFIVDGAFVPNEVLRDSVDPLLAELLKVRQATAGLRGRGPSRREAAHEPSDAAQLVAMPLTARG